MRLPLLPFAIGKWPDQQHHRCASDQSRVAGDVDGPASVLDRCWSAHVADHGYVTADTQFVAYGPPVVHRWYRPYIDPVGDDPTTRIRPPSRCPAVVESSRGHPDDCGRRPIYERLHDRPLDAASQRVHVLVAIAAEVGDPGTYPCQQRENEDGTGEGSDVGVHDIRSRSAEQSDERGREPDIQW